MINGLGNVVIMIYMDVVGVVASLFLRLSRSCCWVLIPHPDESTPQRPFVNEHRRRRTVVAALPFDVTGTLDGYCCYGVDIPSLSLPLSLPLLLLLLLLINAVLLIFKRRKGSGRRGMGVQKHNGPVFGLQDGLGVGGGASSWWFISLPSMLPSPLPCLLLLLSFAATSINTL